jgi:hypothetical protein
MGLKEDITKEIMNILVLLVIGIILIVIGAVVTMPSRTETVAIGYSKVENVDDNTKKVTVNYKGQDKVLTVTKEVNWAPNANWRHTLDEKLVSIEYNPKNDKDFDVYSGPPQYVGSVVLISAGAVSIGFSLTFLHKLYREYGFTKTMEVLREKN